jgi:ketosteroid isomerase-like protein
MQELIRTRDGRSEVNYAIYHDRYRRTGDGWKFTERVYEVRYHDTSPLAGSPPADTRADADAGGLVAFSQPELERFAHTFTELFDAAEPTSMTGYYTEQAQLMADGMTPIRGHGAIGQFWRTAISQATAAGARRTIQLHESHSCGDLGYALCTVTVEVPGAARRAVWDTTIWERDSDGNWRIAVDISTLLP